MAIVMNVYAFLTLLSGIALIVVWADILFSNYIKQKKFTRPLLYLGKNALLLGFIVSLAAVLGSLYFSEILHYDPCKLCWFQRIFMYPQPIIFGAALLLRDNKVFRYSIPLSIFGAIIAAYHYSLQFGVSTGTSCGVIGYSVSCADKFEVMFGYITIPMMALTAFIMLLVLAYLNSEVKKLPHSL